MRLPASNKTIHFVGKYVLAKYPAIADEILSKYSEKGHPPLDTDFENIRFYYLTFCKLQAVEPYDLTGHLGTIEKTDLRRLFIGAMVKIYSPETLHQPSEAISIKRGMGRPLSKLFKVSEQIISNDTYMVIAWLKNGYLDYKVNVDAMLTQLLNENPK